MWRIAIAMLLAHGAAHAEWRSALYPASWQPGFADAQGRFLHDFSHAGYQRGEQPLPSPAVTHDVSTYGADPTGVADSTSAIQRAIDDAGAAGGGVVYLPAGTYRVKPPAGAVAALAIAKSRVVLRGAGAGQTFLFNDEPVMRERRIINVRPDPASHTTWYWNARDERALTSDLAGPTVQLPVADTSGYAVGDWIVVRADPTAAFIAEHGMTGTWLPEQIGGPIFYRRITAVTPATITIDVATRYPLRLRDNARIGRIDPHLEEIGIEHLSIGNRQNPRSGTGDQDYAVAGTGAYEMHDSFAVYFTHVVNGWIRGVSTYRPASNGSAHLLSNGIRLDGSRFVTVTQCDVRRPQYRGAGGNGYMFVVTGSENLVTRSYAELGRHNFDFGLMYVSGNVIHRSTSKDARLPVDFHMHLSMANLIDNLALDNDNIEAINRTCCNHGHSTTQSVIWNTHGLRYPTDQILQKFIVESSQYGHGYVIGTRGPATAVKLGTGADTAPVDWSEGAGMGDTLVPASLYEDQLARRIGPPVEPPVDGDGVPVAPDGGAASDTRPGGCGCRTSAAGPGLPLVVAAIALARRRRTRRTRAP